MAQKRTKAQGKTSSNNNQRQRLRPKMSAMIPANNAMEVVKKNDGVGPSKSPKIDPPECRSSNQNKQNGSKNRAVTSEEINTYRRISLLILFVTQTSGILCLNSLTRYAYAALNQFEFNAKNGQRFSYILRNFPAQCCSHRWTRRGEKFFFLSSGVNVNV